jgi:flagellar hook protein FlgE
MSYQTGLSGLQAASDDLDVIGNNIANANTVGFKSGSAVFADMYANSLLGSGNDQIGMGVSMPGVATDFSQGTPTQTGSPLDLDISGNGFFQLSDNGTTVYTRNGQFTQNASGTIINSSNGLPLMGYGVGQNGVIDTSQLVPLSTASVADLPPQPTTTINWSFNLNSNDPVTSVTPFDPTNTSTYQYSQPATVYDSEGNEMSVDVYFVKTATPGQWTAYVASPNGATNVSTGANPASSYAQLGTVDFNSTGQLTSASTFSFNMYPTSGGTSPQAITLNIGGTTQYAATEDSPTAYSVNGSQAAVFNGQLSVASDGTITASYSNNQSQVIGQIATATFENPEGLADEGNNVYSANSQSGDPQIGSPGGFDHGTLMDYTLESSNVDLTSQLVDLITAQRNYQANAQTIKTQQTVDQTLINI